MTDTVVKIIADFFLPPTGPLIFIAFGLLMWIFRFPKFGALCILLGAVVLYFASTPFMARKLLDPMQYQYPVLKEVSKEAQAIVVLGGGRLPNAREYDNLDTVNAESLERIRYASRLAKIYNLPIIIVGGSVNGERQSEAKLMQHVLETDFGLQTNLLEEKSKNTLENAKFVKFLLNKNSITNFVLVTHAYHMPRAIWSFRQAGLDPTPAPTIIYKRNRLMSENSDYLPQAKALEHTRLALGEYLARLWYQYFKS